MSKPLKNPPVYFTVAQVRFNTILKLSEYLPSIQDRMRQDGFPAFTTQSTFALQFNIQDGQTIPQPISHEQYFFANADQTHSFVLGPDALTFQSTNYGTYELFSAAFLKGLEVLHNIVSLDFTERVGLRYLDHIFPKDAEDLSTYLIAEALGLSQKLAGKPTHSYIEMLNTVDDIQLCSRILTQDGGLVFPPDLQPQGMHIDPRFTKLIGKNSVIDTDGFVQARESFSLDKVKAHLDDVHNVISNAFKMIVTPEALIIWDK